MKKRKVFIWALIVLIVLVVVACVAIFVTCDHDTSSQDDGPSTTTPDDDGNDSHDHVYGEWVIEREATCTDEGMRVRICEVCEDEQTEIILALGHDIIEHAGQAATCTQPGWEAYETCSRCDYTTYAASRERG